MRDGEVIAMLLLGAAALAQRRRQFPPTWDDGWVWPVPPLRPWKGGPVYNPEVSHEFEDPEHFGVDVMYRRKSRQDLVQAFPPGTPDGNARWFAPSRTPILAARAGKVWSVSKTERGWAIVLDHSKPFATFYQHLESTTLGVHKNGVNVNTGTETHVNVGQPMGIMGWDPLDGERLRHLHFSVWFNGSGDAAAVDPGAAMSRWPRVPWAFIP